MSRKQNPQARPINPSLRCVMVPEEGAPHPSRKMVVMRISRPITKGAGTLHIGVKLTPRAKALLQKRINLVVTTKTKLGKRGLRKLAKDIMRDMKRTMAASIGGKALVRKRGRAYMRRIGAQGRKIQSISRIVRSALWEARIKEGLAKVIGGALKRGLTGLRSMPIMPTLLKARHKR